MRKCSGALGHAGWAGRRPPQEAEARLIPKCRFVPIESLWGHRAGDPHRPGQEVHFIY